MKTGLRLGSDLYFWTKSLTRLSKKSGKSGIHEKAEFVSSEVNSLSYLGIFHIMDEVLTFFKRGILNFLEPKFGKFRYLMLRLFFKILLKSTSVKKGCAKSKKTPEFDAGAIFKNCKKILKAKKLLVHWETVDYKYTSMLKW